MLRIRWIPAWIMLILMIVPVLLADQVTLKNGDRLSGSITGFDGKVLNLKTDYAGAVSLKWDAVQTISSDQPLYLTSKGGQVIAGTVSTEDGKFEVATAESGTVSLPRAEVTAIRSKDEQAAYDAALERLRQPHLLDFWSGVVDTSLALSRGNSESTTYNLAANATRTTPRDKISVYATSLFAKGVVNGLNVTTAKAIRGGTRYDFNLADRYFAFGQLDLEHDLFQKLDLRNVLSGGGGYHAIKTDKTVLDLLAGGSFDQTFFSTGLTRRDAEFLAGENYSRHLTKTTTFTEALQFFPNLSQTGEYRSTFDAAIVTQLSRFLSWRVAVSDRILSDPPVGVKKNDLLLTTGLRLTFGGTAPK